MMMTLCRYSRVLPTKGCTYPLEIGYFALKIITHWSTFNELKLMRVKLRLYCFRLKTKYLNINDGMSLNSTPAEILNSLKKLGVMISTSMSQDHYILHLIPKLSRVVGLVCRHIHVLLYNIKHLLQNSVFLSLINYCNFVWGYQWKY